MLPETVPCLKALAPLFGKKLLLRSLKQLSTHGGGLSRLQAGRHFGVSCCLAAKKDKQPRKPREKVVIPGLEMITYAERMHYVPGLAKPVFPHWERDYHDPFHYKPPPKIEMPLYSEKVCYMITQRTNMLEGVRQAAWLTKSKVISGLPPALLSLAEMPENQIPDQDDRVQNLIRHARFWDTVEERPKKVIYSKTLLQNLLHVCGTQRATHPALGRRVFVEGYTLGVSWKRGDDLFQIRGRNGLLHCSMDPLPPVCGEQEVADTSDHVLETFYPISPSIDLLQVNVYKEMNCTGFIGDAPYPHAHTLYFLETAPKQTRLHPEQFRAKMFMFTFGNALARAYKLYGTSPQKVLDRPITVQSVGTNGRIFQFLVFQLNTTDLSGDDGIKNQVWLDGEVDLYQFAKVRPLIKKKQVKVAAGLTGYKPESFRKFLALYMHGAAHLP
ncbi:large ribosomal subunit protein mL37 [Austrofundulus limnaeus]|uniref:Large ribosomal subunit protein mL37 n=1 Tax=Austrofundulus limnaeus TaxID=52670 RepID=A0A2I4DB21_AUSLI|nr:PREDICTED: 39S ribosomal protein L37, mitochondrial [Austrofundulus limnaeus]